METDDIPATGPPPAAGRVSVEYDPAEEEFLEAHAVLTRKTTRLRLGVYLLAAAFMAALAAVLASGMPGPASGRRSLLLPAFVAALALLMALEARYGTRWRLRRMWRNVPHVAQRVRVTLDQEGFHTESASGVATLRWDAFTHYGETPTLLLLYRGPKFAHFLPKRAFDGQQLQAARELLREMIRQTEYRPPERAFPVTPARPRMVEPLEERQPPGA